MEKKQLFACGKSIVFYNDDYKPYKDTIYWEHGPLKFDTPTDFYHWMVKEWGPFKDERQDDNLRRIAAEIHALDPDRLLTDNEIDESEYRDFILIGTCYLEDLDQVGKKMSELYPDD
jgi:hypothetical protein